MKPGNEKKKLAYCIALIPILAYFFIVLSYSTNIPNSDDYDYFIFLEQYHSEVDWLQKVKLIFGQHNEHRIAYNRIILLINYYLTGTISFTLQVLLGNISLIGLLFIFYKAFCKNNISVYFFLPVPFILFQLQFYENSTWALAALQNFSVLFFSYLSLYFLEKGNTNLPLTSIIFAVIATFTSGSGMFTFVAGTILLILQRRFNPALAAWLITAIASVSIYFANYISYGEKPGLITSLITYPHKLIVYIFSFLGSSLNLSGNVGSYIAVTVGLLICLFFLYLVYIRYDKKNLLVFSLLSLILLTAVAAALSRYSSSIQQAFLSRYKIHSAILIILVYIAALDIFNNKIKQAHLYIFMSLALLFNICSYVINIETVSVRKMSILFGAYALQNTPSSYAFLSFYNPQTAHKLLVNSQKLGYYSLPPKVEPYAKSQSLQLELPAEGTMMNAFFNVVDFDKYFIMQDGWATFKDYNSAGNEIFVVLQSQYHTYIFNTYASLRPDVTASLGKLNFDNSGFTCIINKNDIAYGIYQIGIYIRKNNNIQAFQFFDKTISHLKAQEPVDMILPAQTERKVLKSIDEFQESAALVQAKGWAIIEGINAKNSTIYMVLKSAQESYVFPTLPVKRPDVTKNLNTLDFDDSGFVCKFSKNKLKPGIYQLGIYIRKEDGSQAIEFIDKTIHHISLSEPVAINIPAQTERKVLKSIDEFRDSLEVAQAKGWAIIEGINAKNSTIYMVLKSAQESYVFPTLPVKRPDVTKNLNTLDFDDSGFVCKFSKNKLKPGIYQLGIYIRKEDGSQAIEFIDKTIHHISLSEPVAINIPAQTERKVLKSIDEFQESAALVQAKGWAIIEGINAKNSTIYMVLKSAQESYVFPTLPVKRPDVTKNLNTLDFDDSGFVCKFSKNKLKPGIYQLGIYIRKEDGSQAIEFIRPISI